MEGTVTALQALPSLSRVSTLGRGVLPALTGHVAWATDELSLPDHQELKVISHGAQLNLC